MSNGQFWIGQYGFLYKKNVGVGGRRSTRMGPGLNANSNQPTDLNNRYSPGGGGVGASSVANRRAKNRLATNCGPNGKCFPCYNTLGQYSKYTHNPNGFVFCPPFVALSSSSSSVTPTPTPTPSGGYTLTYSNANAGAFGGGTAPAPTTSYSGGDGVVILGNTFTYIRPSPPAPTLRTFEFGGWNTSAGGTGTYYPPGSTLTMPYADTILYAQWYETTAGQTTYSVIYDGNGSTGGAPPPTLTNKYRNEGIGPIPGNTGSLVNGSLTFNGWNTAANGLGTSYPVSSNGFTMPAANVTLYAQWVNTSATSYALTYVGNGNTSGSVPSQQYYPSGTSVGVISLAPIAKSGYTFIGWNTDLDGLGLNYSNNASIVMDSPKSLHAQWVGGTVAKSCGAGSGGGSIMASASRDLYRDNTNNTMTTIIQVQYSDSSGAPYGTGNGPVNIGNSGNMLNSYSRVELSEVTPGVYTFNISYVTNWRDSTGAIQTQTQTDTLTLIPTYWPTGQKIQDVTVSNSPAGFAFSTSPTPDGSVTVNGGCFTAVSGVSDGTTVVETSSQIIAFYITFNNSPQTTTRVAVGVQTRWSRPASSSPPYTYTLVYNRTRVELANGATPVPITGSFPSSSPLPSSVNSS